MTSWLTLMPGLDDGLAGAATAHLRLSWCLISEGGDEVGQIGQFQGAGHGEVRAISSRESVKPLEYSARTTYPNSVSGASPPCWKLSTYVVVDVTGVRSCKEP